MNIVLLLCFIVVSIEANAIKEKTECEGVHVRDKFHKKEVLARGLDRPYQLALLKKHHRLFFSYNVGSHNEDTFKIAYIEKNHTGHTELSEVENGFALAADNANDVIYCGGSDGIYKYHGHSQETEKILHDQNIWDLFHGKHLFFITYPKHHLYKLETVKNETKHERVPEIHEQIYSYLIDKDGDKFFTNESGLFRIKSGSKKRISFVEDKGPYRALELDNKGEAYFCGAHGIYVADKKKNSLERIVHVNNIFGLTFDHDNNIIYSDPHEIVRLLPETC